MNRKPARTAPADPLAEKHRTPSLEKDWRCVDYKDLGAGPMPDDARRSALLGPGWVHSTGLEARQGEAFSAHFGSFGGGTVHADVVRLSKDGDASSGRDG